jgi:hypothetical protein
VAPSLSKYRQVISFSESRKILGMNTKPTQDQILTAARESKPKKKRATFSITEDSERSLAIWCKERKLTKSSVIEAMIQLATLDGPWSGMPGENE